MTTQVNVNRQSVLYAERDFDYQDFVSGTPKELIYLPAGAKVLRGYVDITTDFDPETSWVFTVGDTEGSTPDVDRYDAAIDATSTGISTFTGPANGVIETAEAITMTATVVDAAGALTQGAGKLAIEYVVDNRVTELHTYRG